MFFLFFFHLAIPDVDEGNCASLGETLGGGSVGVFVNGLMLLFFVWGWVSNCSLYLAVMQKIPHEYCS